MTKAEELANPRSCLANSQDDEPLFVLCARDRIASQVVRYWARLADDVGVPMKKTDDALRLANAMDTWREAHGGGKRPD